MKEILRFLQGHDKFLLATHLNPDGDALGSALALSMALESLGKQAHVYDRDGVPPLYAFLPGAERVRKSLDGLGNLPTIILDCNTPERAGLKGHPLGPSAVIDHHETEAEFGDPRWVDPSEPATGLMVYKIIKALGLTLTREIAQNLFTALALDTGTFRYANTNAEVLRAAADLTEAGAEPGYVSDRLYNTWTAGRFRLFCLNLGSLELSGPIAVTSVTARMVDAAGAREADTENFVNFPLQMDEVQVSVLLRQRAEGEWKCSMRSKGAINVATVASKFEGGGHQNAAGCFLRGNYEEAKAALLLELLKITK